MMIATSLLTNARAAALSLAVVAASSATTAAAQADRIASTEVVGTAFRVTLSSGRVLQGTELEGATLSLALPGHPAPRRLRMDRIVPDPLDPAHEVLLYRVTVLDEAGAGAEACEPDLQGHRWMFPVRGQWDAEGRHVSDASVTLTCSDRAQGKCVRFGYHSWTVLPDGTDLAEYHRTCVLLVRADYCGDRPTTRNGMTIDIYDRLGIQRRAEGSGAGLRPPRWPEAVLEAIDRPAAAGGAAHYASLCAGCHETRWTTVPAGADGPGAPARPEIAVKTIPLARIGTDPNAAANFAARRAFVAPGSDQTVSATDGLQDVTDRIIERWFARNAVPEAARREMAGLRRNEWRDPLAYRARPLDGVWATAPYLHNGSVPSLYQMLLPAGRRDAQFTTGSRQFDLKAVGFETAPFRGGFRFDTAISGKGNQGHFFGGAAGALGVIGPELADAQRWELVEYLKTL